MTRNITCSLTPKVIVLQYAQQDQNGPLGSTVNLSHSLPENKVITYLAHFR